MHQNVLFLIKKISEPATSQSLDGILYSISLSCGCVCWYSMHVSHYSTVFLMFAFICTQYTYLCTKNLIFSISLWLLCICCSICFCNRKGIIILYTSWQCHQSLPIHFSLANSVSCCALIYLSCVASPVLYMI